jgi:hypothetical protein
MGSDQNYRKLSFPSTYDRVSSPLAATGVHGLYATAPRNLRADGAVDMSFASVHQPAAGVTGYDKVPKRDAAAAGCVHPSAKF